MSYLRSLLDYPAKEYPLTPEYTPHIEKVPDWLLPVTYLWLAAAVAARSRLVTITLCLFEAYWAAMLPFYSMGDFISTQSMATSFISMVYKSLIMLLLVNQEEYFTRKRPQNPGLSKHVKKEASEDQKKDLVTAPGFWTRWKEVLAALMANRGVGWSFQVKNIPQGVSAECSRSTFIFSTLISSLKHLLIGDFLSTYLRLLTPLGHSPFKPNLYEVPWYEAFFYSFAAWQMLRSSMIAFYGFAAIAAVGSGISEAWTWPPLHGSWLDAWTVRRHWSFSWHQMTRIFTEPPANCITHSLLNVRRGTYASNYLKLFIVFFISATMHSYASVVAVGHDLGDMKFFMSQAVAIWFEETVVRIAKAAGLGSQRDKEPWWGWKALGYTWTAAWMGYSLRGWINGAASNAAFAQNQLPFSIAEMVLRILGLVK